MLFGERLFVGPFELLLFSLVHFAAKLPTKWRAFKINFVVAVQACHRDIGLTLGFLLLTRQVKVFLCNSSAGKSAVALIGQWIKYFLAYQAGFRHRIAYPFFYILFGKSDRLSSSSQFDIATIFEQHQGVVEASLLNAVYSPCVEFSSFSVLRVVGHEIVDSRPILCI